MRKSTPLLLPALFYSLTLGSIPTALAGPAAFPTGKYLAGQFAVEFNEKGQVRFTQGDSVLVEGEFSAKTDTISLTDRSGPMACLDAGQETGTYRWKIEGGALTFTKVDDRCDGRSQDLTAQAWRRKG